jgi:hypothetical protein
VGKRQRSRRPDWKAVGQVVTFLLGTAEQLVKLIGSIRGIF